jgi:ribosomal protein S18 acetylase RimI-like enzyme
VTLHYRTPTLDDVDELSRLHVLCWQQAYEGLLPEEFLRDLSVEQRAASWRLTVANPGAFVLVACFQDKIAGFVSCGPSRKEAASFGDGEVYAIYIHRDHYRKGIGRRFMAEAAKFWLAKGGRSLVVMFIAANAQAELFYQSLGGVKVWEGMFEIAGIPVPDKAHVFNNLAELSTSA